MSNEKKVWISNVLSSSEINYYIGAGFPSIDYKRMFILEHKRHNAQVVNTDIVFTADEGAELKMFGELNTQSWKGSTYKQGMHTLPDKLWTSDTKAPKKNQHVFTTTGNGLVLSEACGEIFKQFNLGKTRLAKVQIYNMGTLEPDDERFFYFLDIAEWRHYLIPEKSGKSVYDSGYKKHGYDYYTYKSYRDDCLTLSEDAEKCDLDLWHDPMLMRSVFLSNRLYEALKNFEITDSWFLKQCKLV